MTPNDLTAEELDRLVKNLTAALDPNTVYTLIRMARRALDARENQRQREQDHFEEFGRIRAVLGMGEYVPVGDSYAVESDCDQVEARCRELVRRVGELEARLAKRFYPDECMFTGLKFFMLLTHSEYDDQEFPTYGGPYDSYTIPERDDDGGFTRMRFDHDKGGWEEGVESMPIAVVCEHLKHDHDKLKTQLATMRAERDGIVEQCAKVVDKEADNAAKTTPRSDRDREDRLLGELICRNLAREIRAIPATGATEQPPSAPVPPSIVEN